MRKRIRIGFLLWILVSPAVFSQDTLSQILEYLTNTALSVHISVRLLGENKEIEWDAESTFVTVSGRAVKVFLVGEDILINAYITPFGDIREKLLLVAYGELVLVGESEETIKYETFLKSLPVDPGESVIFFPLGIAVDSETNIYTIELEIQLLPYRESEQGAENNTESE